MNNQSQKSYKSNTKITREQVLKNKTVFDFLSDIFRRNYITFSIKTNKFNREIICLSFYKNNKKYIWKSTNEFYETYKSFLESPLMLIDSEKVYKFFSFIKKKINDKKDSNNSSGGGCLSISDTNILLKYSNKDAKYFTKKELEFISKNNKVGKQKGKKKIEPKMIFREHSL